MSKKKSQIKLTAKLNSSTPHFVVTNKLYDHIALCALDDLRALLSIDEKRDPVEVEHMIQGAVKGFACFKDILQGHME